MTSFGTFNAVPLQFLHSAVSTSGESVDVLIDADGLIAAVGTGLGPTAGVLTMVGQVSVKYNQGAYSDVRVISVCLLRDSQI